MLFSPHSADSSTIRAHRPAFTLHNVSRAKIACRSRFDACARLRLRA
jgi:hypothetical protein